MKALALLYGGIAYLMFLASSLYAIGFVGNLAVPKSIDSQGDASLVAALVTDALLLAVFAIQHSVMARPAFKAAWTSIVPASVERATYVLLSSLLLFLVFWQWRALPQVVWQAGSDPARMAIWGLFWVGWLIAILSTFMVSHWDLLGLRQVMLDFLGKPYTHLPFMTRGLYRVVRHPLMLGFTLRRDALRFPALPDSLSGTDYLKRRLTGLRPGGQLRRVLAWFKIITFWQKKTSLAGRRRYLGNVLRSRTIGNNLLAIDLFYHLLRQSSRIIRGPFSPAAVDSRRGHPY